jgi:RNA polymerase sigma factor (sigma-70 family)
MPRRPPFYLNCNAVAMERNTGVGRVPAVNELAEAVDIPPQAAPAALPLSHEFTSFYAECRDSVARAVSITIGDRDLAVEAVDEAMARAYERWARVARLENPGGWVYRVALNWATSVLRRRNRPWPRAAQERAVEAPVASEPDVIRALAELDVRQRAVVVCRYILGWSEIETAEALSTPVGTVKSRLFRANRELSGRLAHLNEHDGKVS